MHWKNFQMFRLFIFRTVSFILYWKIWISFYFSPFRQHTLLNCWFRAQIQLKAVVVFVCPFHLKYLWFLLILNVIIVHINYYIRLKWFYKIIFLSKDPIISGDLFWKNQRIAVKWPHVFFLGNAIFGCVRHDLL